MTTSPGRPWSSTAESTPVATATPSRSTSARCQSMNVAPSPALGRGTADRQPVARRSGHDALAAPPLGQPRARRVLLRPRRHLEAASSARTSRGHRVSWPVDGSTDAGDDRVAGVAHLTGLVAPNARPDLFGVAPRHLSTRSGSASCARVISTPSQTAIADRPLGLPRVDDRALQEHRHVRPRALILPAEFDVEPCRLVEVGPGLLDREDRPAHDDQIVDASRRQRGGDLGGLLRRDPRPRRQLVTRQPQADDAVGPRPARTAAITWRANSSRSGPHSSPR